jgi:serine/threonine protein kinase
VLGNSRVELVGATPYAHEREAIDFVVEQLPNNDPYLLWGLVDLLDASSGRLYEIDLIVLGFSALYLIEIKSGPGLYEGNEFDWTVTPAEGRTRVMDPPYTLTNHKAKVLASRLRAKMADAPYVQPLVFLSHPDTKLKLTREGRLGVLTRADIARAITQNEFPGSDPNRRRTPINKPVMRGVAEAMRAMGIRKRAGQAYVGDWALGEVLEDGPGYQDREATHRTNKSMHRRARIYLVPSQTSVERRAQLRRAADREAQMLNDVRDHVNVLQCTDFVPDAPLGPTVLFDAFEDGLRLDVFLRKNPDLSFFERIAIIDQVGRALDYCHRRGIRHGGVSPEAVVVRRRGEPSVIEAKLFNFQLGWGDGVQATVHRSALASEPSSIYQAPELREDPRSGGPQSDVFSLGALAYFLLTGRPPATSVSDLNARLQRDGSLNPCAVEDSIRREVGDVVATATALSIGSRFDDVGEWVEYLLEYATKPVEPIAAAEIHPLEARKGDVLGGDLMMLGVLGHGATSRVLRVERSSDRRTFALKISLGPEHDTRLAAEAHALGLLRHPRIVQCHETRTIGGRSCLLLSIAGDRTLHQQLTEEGTVPLDYAVRYGEDLLSALEQLEEKDLTHRDIKPANLGIGGGGPTKSAHHLELFDLSLVDSSKTDLDMGTGAYRDPFLRERGSWDNAADLWSAAVTMHEMLTGIRPSYGSALDPEAQLKLAAERFDPTVRDRLIAFFQKALARHAGARFATAKDMGREWRRVFEAAQQETKDASAPAELTPYSDDELRAITSETSIESLPLTAQAKNALDRAGLVRADDLLKLPKNSLSAIRGIGSKVSKEVLAFRDRWRALRSITELATTPYYPGYGGEDLLVEASSLPPAVAVSLQHAGLPTLASVAAAPEGQLATLAERASFPLTDLRALLDLEHRKADERDHPTTLEGWIQALLPVKKKAFQHARLVYGLEEPFLGRLDVSVKKVATHLAITTAAIYLAVGRYREIWKQHPAIAELCERCHGVLDGAGGALRLERLADELLATLAHDRGAERDVLRARAGALLRIVCEVERDAEAGLTIARIHEVPWMFSAGEDVDRVRRLGDAADALAAKAVLASPGEVQRALGALVGGGAEAASSALAGLAPERLVDLAADASRTAAKSTRLEIYPRDMRRERALELTAGILTGQLSADEVRQRVAARYPQAVPLPPRPELDALLEPLGLRWSAQDGAFLRPGEAAATSLHTSFSPVSHARTALPTQPKAMSADAIAAREFEERLRVAVDKKSFRLLGVSADRAAEATRRISELLHIPARALDKLLIAEMQRLMADKKVSAAVVNEADRLGPAGKTWGNLAALAKLAASALAAKLLPPKEPLLLVQPGLLARYQLADFVSALVTAAKADEAAAILLLVPAHDTGSAPLINGRLAVPDLLAGQTLWVPREWLGNKHNAAAE